MKFQTASSPQAYTEITEQISDLILRGELRKGDKLPSERQIALQTGICRTSVREAIKILTEAGMLQVTSGWGGGSRLVNVFIPAHLLGVPIDDDPRLLLEIYEARNIIETAAAQLTALRATPELLLEMEQTVIEMQRLIEENPKDYEAYFLIDTHFHRLVVKGSGNSVFFDMYIPILRRLWQLKDLINLVDMHSYGLLSMQQFVQAVRSKDPKAALAAIEAHIKPLIDLLKQGYENRHPE